MRTMPCHHRYSYITQNADGFWGTDPMAVGLYNNYKVGAGFFDTRWDTEAALSLLRGYRKYNEPHFLKAAIEFSDFTVNLHFELLPYHE